MKQDIELCIPLRVVNYVGIIIQFIVFVLFDTSFMYCFLI